jgi:multiple sugar transport system substrate-binding protein
MGDTHGLTRGLMQDLLTGKIGRRDFIVRALALGVSLSGVEAILQACGGGGGGAPGAVTVTWSTWGNPGELDRFTKFTNDFNSKHTNVQAQLIPIPSASDYPTKILTELTSHTAPDVFYAGAADVARFRKDNQIMELTSLLSGPNSQSKPEDFIAGLYGAAKTPDGKIFGVPVDCNPLVLWVNKTVLQNAGVTTLPNDLYAQGQWNWNAFQSMIQKVHNKGQYGYILDDWDSVWYSWVTANAGTVYENNGNGKFVANTDPKAVEAFKFLSDNVKAKNIIFAGTLPKGQGTDLSFMAKQAAFVCAGRWYLPEFKQIKSSLAYDVVPFPTNTGKPIEPADVALAYMVMNAATKHQNEAFEFLTSFVSPAGQTFRLSGGGNAVPSIKGPDQVVLEGNDPAHAQIFLDARNIGYADPASETRVAGLNTDIQNKIDAIWFKNADVQTTLNQVATLVNARITPS